MIPDAVIRHVRRQLDTLSILPRARQTDEKFSARSGRYEGETYLHHEAALERAWNTLTEFERLCHQNGEDPYIVYARHGWPARLSAAAKAWLPESTVVPAQALPIVDPLAVAWIESGVSPVDLQALERAGGYGAILLDKSAQLDLQDTLDCLLEQRLLNVRNALRALGWDGERNKPLHRSIGERRWTWAHAEKKVGAGRNVVSLEYLVFENTPSRTGTLMRFSDPMRSQASVLASLCELTLQTQVRSTPLPVCDPDLTVPSNPEGDSSQSVDADDSECGPQP